MNTTAPKNCVRPTTKQRDELNKHFETLRHMSPRERNKLLTSNSPNKSYKPNWNAVRFSDKLNTVVAGQLLALKHKLSGTRRHVHA